MKPLHIWEFCIVFNIDNEPTNREEFELRIHSLVLVFDIIVL
jgi:hypothetical protein